MPWPVEQLCRLILSIYDRMLVLDLEHLAIDGRTTRAPCGDEEAPGQAQRDAGCNGERATPNAWTGRSRRPDVTDPASGMLSCPPRGRRPIRSRLATPAALGDTAAGIDLVDRLAHGRVWVGSCRGLGAALGDEHARA